MFSLIFPVSDDNNQEWLTSTRYKIQDTRYKIQDTRYKIQDTRYKIQESLFNVGYMIILVTLAHLSYFPSPVR